MTGRFLLEEAVPGFEVGCAVLGNESSPSGPVDEIELSRGFFNYDGEVHPQDLRHPLSRPDLPGKGRGNPGGGQGASTGRWTAG